MTWSARLLSLLAPPQEPTNDPRVLEQAARESERRIVRDEIERARRMEEYAKAWSGPKLIRRDPAPQWFREQKVG